MIQSVHATPAMQKEQLDHIDVAAVIVGGLVVVAVVVVILVPVITTPPTLSPSSWFSIPPKTFFAWLPEQQHQQDGRQVCQMK